MNATQTTSRTKSPETRRSVAQRPVPEMLLEITYYLHKTRSLSKAEPRNAPPVETRQKSHR
jgi:hypothetical protein